MMKKIIYIVILTFFGVVAKGQNISIQLDTFKSKNGYEINIVKTINKESNLHCYVINLLASDISSNEGKLYVFKAFTDKIIKIKRNKFLKRQVDSLNTAYAIPSPPKKQGIKTTRPGLQKTIIEFHSIKKNIDKILELNKLIGIDLKSHPHGNYDYQMVFDNLTLVTNDSIYYFNGSVLLQYFSLYDFEQITPLQSSQTVINTKSTITTLNNLSKTTGNPADSVFLYPDFIKQDYNVYRKIYLTKIISKDRNQEFIFCRLILKKGFDDFLQQTEFFTYKPKIGINGFNGIYVYKSGPSTIIARFSDRIFNFEPLENLNFESK